MVWASVRARQSCLRFIEQFVSCELPGFRVSLLAVPPKNGSARQSLPCCFRQKRPLLRFVVSDINRILNERRRPAF